MMAEEIPAADALSRALSRARARSAHVLIVILAALSLESHLMLLVVAALAAAFAQRTTKAVGQGTGLGLSIRYSIVQSYGGRLTAHSRPGAGATLVVDLPAHDGAMAAAPAAAAPTAPWIGRGHVLVVDDEPDVVDVRGDLLRELGVRVTAVADGESARRELTGGTLVFDAVSLDLRMPGRRAARSSSGSRSGCPRRRRA